MKEKIYNARTGMEYVLVGDYYLPALKLPRTRPVGRWGIALQQIDDRMYAKEYEDDYDQILCYGISFFKKRCMVKKK